MLQHKHVPIDSLCPTCRRGEETIAHALISCPFVVQYWQLLVTEFQWNVEDEFTHWWEQVFTKYDNDKRAEIATVCWSLWKARNEVVWNNKYTRAHVVIAKAKQYLEQWRFARN